MDFNAIADIVNATYIFMVTLGYLLMVWLMYLGMNRVIWASQFGGMNSMGSRNYTAEALGYFFAAMICGYFSWFANSVMGDMTGQQYKWKNLQATGDNLKFIGDFLTSAFTLVGFAIAYRTAGLAKKVGTGEVTVSTIIVNLLIAVLCTQLPWISQQISTFTPFNPMGLFFGQPIISIK